MKLLLDTHTFIWWDSNSAQLSDSARRWIADRSNEVYVSLVSIWEIQIKRNLGKLTLRKPIFEIIEDQRKNGILFLPIALDHILYLEELGDHHRDPFDRLLAAQAIKERLTLVTKDVAFEAYKVAVAWG